MNDATLADLILAAERHFDGNELDQAESLATEALRRDASQPRALQVLGMVHSRRDRPGEAIPILERALSLRPDLPSSHNDLGLSYNQLGDVDVAMRHFDQALLLNPQHAPAHFNRALANLKLGRFHEGWVEYEWRFLSAQVSRPEIPVPRWDGSPLKGKSLLIHTEQGIGDVLQFVRFLPLLKRQGARVVLACQKAIRPLLGSLPGVDEWIPIDQETQITFDYYAPLLSLPALLMIHDESAIPCRVPYIHPEIERVEKWRSALGAGDGLRVGISWQGSRTFRGDGLRSIPLEHFAPIAQVPGVQLISLQHGYGTEQIAQQARRVPVTTLEGMDQDGAFLDTAALMQSLDLIITSDTAIAHLSGALGRPTWVALSTAADWRWQLDRDDSPWYPTVRLFRQPDLGNWPSVFLEMAQTLERMCD